MSDKEKKMYFYGLEDAKIDRYVQGLGFKKCVHGIAKFRIGHNSKRFLYISSGQFGMAIGMAKKIFYPKKEYWEALREQQKLAQVIFIMIGYENCQPWTVNRRKRNQEPVSTSLANWYDHSGLIVIERDEAGRWKKMRYFDCQFYDGEKLSGHFAYKSVTKSLMNIFSDHVGIENAFSAPLSYVIEALVKGKDTNPYKTRNSMSRFLDEVCQYLERLGLKGMRGSVPWEELKKSTNK